MTLDAQELRTRAAQFGQEHLFAFYDKLDAVAQQKLLTQIAAIEFPVVEQWSRKFIGVQVSVAASVAGTMLPAEVITTPATPAQLQAQNEARALGEEAYRQGRVGCFLVAGGQGTRLGFDGPKGAFVVGPVSSRTLFQIHAEKINALRKRYQTVVPWLIMTSDANDAQTRDFFEAHNYFGLGRDTVRIFKQANMPAVDRTTGKILLQAPDEVALSPNGHGGSIKALVDSGATQWLRSLRNAGSTNTAGVDTLFYFQVDNVLTNIGDPTFIGYHLKANSQMSSKACRKRDWKEKVGVFGVCDGKQSVIEYSDLPDNVAQETAPDGSLRWWAGSIAIHVLDVGFIEELNRGGFQLPYHKAEKSVPHIDESGRSVGLKSGEKNGIKFETFVFDALGYAQRTVHVETQRQNDFSPVKNASGEDSLLSVQNDMMEQYARWLSATGTVLPRKPDGTLDCRIEISPLTSLEGENLAGKAPASVAPGQTMVL